MDKISELYLEYETNNNVNSELKPKSSLSHYSNKWI